MMSSAVRFLVAMSAVAFVGCSSGNHSGTSGTGGHPGSGGTVGSGGMPGSGGRPTGGDTGRGGAGGAGGQGGASAVSDAGAFLDATAVDVSACPVCPPMKCPYGSPVDGDGCTVCACSPAPDGGVDVPLGSVCGLPEGCADAGKDTGSNGEAGATSDVSRVEAAGIKCGTAVCGTGQYCCNPVANDCAPIGSACAL